MIRIKKAQLSVEFILALGVIVFLFFVFFGLMLNKNHDLKVLQDSVNKKTECLRLSNLISSTYKSGPGTEVNTKTKYLINILNDTRLVIRDLGSINKTDNNIAVLFSEAGPSQQNVYDRINNSLHPDWYKVCFNDNSLGNNGPGCATNLADDTQRNGVRSTTGVNWGLIPNNFSDLINNINNYQTIYLADPHLHLDRVDSLGRPYIQILQDWVNSGNILVTSEHFYCRESPTFIGANGGLDYWRCNPRTPYQDDIWPFFNRVIDQRSVNDILYINQNRDPFSFTTGTSYNLNEDSFIRINLSQNLNTIESESLGLSPGGFTSTSTCHCYNPSSGSCISSTSTSVESNASFIFTRPTGNYNLQIRTCPKEGVTPNGGDAWTVYIDGNKYYDWKTLAEGALRKWQDKVIESVNIPSGSNITISCKAISGTSSCISDYVMTSTDTETLSQTTVATYSIDKSISIASMTYGRGLVYYIPKFEVQASQTSYTDSMISLVKNAYYILLPKNEEESICSFFGVATYSQATGNIKIQNDDNKIYIIQN